MGEKIDVNDIKKEIIFRQIGAKIAYYRTLRRLHQDQLAELAHISTSVLSRIERGKYNGHISVAMILDIAEGLRVAPTVFLSFNDDEKNMWWEDLSSMECQQKDEEAMPLNESEQEQKDEE